MEWDHFCNTYLKGILKENWNGTELGWYAEHTGKCIYVTRHAKRGELGVI